MPNRNFSSQLLFFYLGISQRSENFCLGIIGIHLLPTMSYFLEYVGRARNPGRTVCVKRSHSQQSQKLNPGPLVWRGHPLRVELETQLGPLVWRDHTLSRARNPIQDLVVGRLKLNKINLICTNFN